MRTEQRQMRMDGSPNQGLSRRQVTQTMAGAAVAALAGVRPGRTQSVPTLTIGVLLPQSGYLAQAGQACQRGVEIAPAILADMGYAVEILGADTESNPEVARSRAEKLIGDGAHVLVGAFSSGDTAAIAQVCEQRGVPLVINIAAAPQITEQGYRTVFRNFPTSPTLIRNGLGLMKDLFAATGTTPATAVFLHANDTFGRANKAALDALFPTMDMPFEIVEAISYDPRAQDLAVEVTKARARRPDLVIVTTRANDAILIVREMVKQRFEPMGLISPGSPGFYDEQFYDVLGSFSDYCITNLPWVNPHSELAQRLAAAFQARYPDVRYAGFQFNVGFTFEALLIAADAARRAGSTASEALLEALRTTALADKVMIGGPIRFDATGQNQTIASAAVQNRGQAPTVVLPATAAETAPVFPMPGWRDRA